MTANNKFDFGVVFDTPIVEDFTINHKSRERYEGTEEEFQDKVKEAQRETLAPKVEEQLHSTANKQKGFIDEFLEFGAFAVRVHSVNSNFLSLSPVFAKSVVWNGLRKSTLHISICRISTLFAFWNLSGTNATSPKSDT